MFEDERILCEDGKKYILQNPHYNNCGLVAIFNAILDDNPNINLETLFKYEKYINKKYSVSKIGLQPTMLGEIAWKFGYYSYMMLSPSCKEDLNTCLRENVKIVRIFGWDANFGAVASNELHVAHQNYINKFKKYEKKYNKRLQINNNKIGAHAFFVKQLDPQTGDSYGINYLIGANGKINFFNIGLYPERYSNGYVMGTEYCILLRKNSLDKSKN